MGCGELLSCPENGTIYGTAELLGKYEQQRYYQEIFKQSENSRQKRYRTADYI